MPVPTLALRDPECPGPGPMVCDEVANRKIHGTTGEIPFERLAEEQRYLQPLAILENRYLSSKIARPQDAGWISIDGEQVLCTSAVCSQTGEVSSFRGSGSSFWMERK